MDLGLGVGMATEQYLIPLLTSILQLRYSGGMLGLIFGQFPLQSNGPFTAIASRPVFTGLIQALGTVKALGGDRFAIDIQGDGAGQVMSDLALGDSVAVDGVCLTVETIAEQGFVATASPKP